MICSKLYKDKNWLHDQYWNKNKSIRQIAEECNCDLNNIYYFMKKFDIPRRNLNDSHKGYVMPEEQKEKIRHSMKGKANYFKGKDAGYQAKHIYVRKRKLKPEKCENCGKKTIHLELCSKDHNYTRNPEDYYYFCKSCHIKYEKENGLR